MMGREQAVAGFPARNIFTRSGQLHPFGAKPLSAYPTEEKINGQGSTEKQPREEETETGEGKTGGRRIAVFRPAAEAHGRFFIGQETIARAAAAGMVQCGVLEHFAGLLSANHAENSLFNLRMIYKPLIINDLQGSSDPLHQSALPISVMSMPSTHLDYMSINLQNIGI